MNISDALNAAGALLKDAGVDQPSRQAASLLTFTLERGYAFVIAHPEYDLSSAEELAFFGYVSRRAGREPLQYITLRQEFWGLEFELTPGVLIPRPETEILVEAAIGYLRTVPDPTLCDVGVGSGSIAVSILHSLPNARAAAVDVSPDALDTARRNAEKHGVGDRLLLRHSDLLSNVDEMFDAVLSNPPYIPADELAGLQEEVQLFEGHLALDGGPDGLDVVRRLLKQASNRLKPGGLLLIEIGVGQAEATLQLFEADTWHEPTVLSDLQSIARVVRSTRR